MPAVAWLLLCSDFSAVLLRAAEGSAALGMVVGLAERMKQGQAQEQHLRPQGCFAVLMCTTAAAQSTLGV